MKKRKLKRESAIKESAEDSMVVAWARLLRVGQALLNSVEADLKRKGMPPLAHYDALLELRRAGKQGLRPFELQREMLLAQYSVSRLVDRLEKAGVIERELAVDDGRGQVLRITQAGKDQMRRMWPVYREAIERHFGKRLSDSETKSLADLLAKLIPD